MLDGIPDPAKEEEFNSSITTIGIYFLDFIN
jgi:hypothetical protein